MRQRELRNAEAFDVVDAPVAAPMSEPKAQPAAAVPDMPKAAGVMMIVAYAALMSAFAVTIHGARADFAIIIGFFYLAMLIGIPAMMLHLEKDGARRPDLYEFLERGIETATGRIGGGEALVQMLLVPVLLVFAVLAMGITYLLV
jgi:hypothetical protein